MKGRENLLLDWLTGLVLVIEKFCGKEASFLMRKTGENTAKLLIERRCPKNLKELIEDDVMKKHGMKFELEEREDGIIVRMFECPFNKNNPNKLFCHFTDSYWGEIGKYYDHEVEVKKRIADGEDYCELILRRRF
ncbi:MAG: hypothetical protein ACE5K4_09140 [Candidatus Hydrothermarchaeota archaeon]